MAYQLENELGNAIIVFGADIKGKPQLMVTISKSVTEMDAKYHAGNMVRELAKAIKGGGGGQAFFATAGGKDVSGLESAVGNARGMVWWRVGVLAVGALAVGALAVGVLVFDGWKSSAWCGQAGLFY